MKANLRGHRLFAILCLLLAPVLAMGQGKASLAGTVKDAGGAVLQGARIVLDPGAQPAITDGQGQFLLTSLAPGSYKVTVSYVGFESYTKDVTLTAGQVARIDASLKVSANKQEVTVYAGREHGDADAINRTRAAENILQVLPAEVITSLPNANIADALGRMPSVTIERDEGEGKYVQIRGTEPRLSNTMVDGVTIPSPESGVRQIKLDTIASDLVDSVEINKTLQANIDADGIGGSVNLVTKLASEEPTVAIYGVGGYTHILDGRTVDQFGATIGRRFLASKKLGVLIGGTYDYNGRGINDIEPVPDKTSATPHYYSMDFRDYQYQRTRYGFTGGADYKLREGSDIAVRGLFSTFRNWGYKGVFTTNDGATQGDSSNPQYSQDWRRPNLAVGSIALQGNHVFNSSTIKWNLSVSRSRSLGGGGGASYNWIGNTNTLASNGSPLKTDCVNDQSVAPSKYRPGWSHTGCGILTTTGPNSVFDKNNYALVEYDLPGVGQGVQLNLQASGSYSRLYHFGTRFGTLEIGGKIRNAHKFDDTYQTYYTPTATDAFGNAVGEPIRNHPEWTNNSFKDPVYYDGSYGGPYPTITSWPKVGDWVRSAIGNSFTNQGGPGSNLPGNFDLIERIPAGYVMNTIELASRVRLVTGVRFEATHVSTLSYDGGVQPPTPPPTTLTFKAGGDYLDVLPSASLRFALDKDSDLRLVYGRGLSRPNPQDITAAVGQVNLSQTPYTTSLGNPNLKAEHANDYDVLYERFFNPLGLFEVGYFYKDLSDPIVTEQYYTTTGNFPHVPAGSKVLVTQPINAGSAHVQGVEIAFQQRMSYLPSVLGGLGISANYSYTNSQAKGVDPLRDDTPALLRQAPNTWNFSPTYDTKHFSMRVGMTYNDAMIYAYQYQDLAYVTDPITGNPIIGADGKPETMPNPQVLGTKGPAGDNYLYAHYQFDTQATYKLPYGFSVYAYGLNLNNEVFGFYNGSGEYVVQREYYHPSYAGGIRWNLTRDK